MRFALANRIPSLLYKKELSFRMERSGMRNLTLSITVSVTKKELSFRMERSGMRNLTLSITVSVTKKELSFRMERSGMRNLKLETTRIPGYPGRKWIYLKVFLPLSSFAAMHSSLYVSSPRARMRGSLRNS
jgi:hypothetical protein